MELREDQMSSFDLSVSRIAMLTEGEEIKINEKETGNSILLP